MSMALALMRAELGAETCCDIEVMLDRLGRLVKRGVIGEDLQAAFIETLGDELAIQKIANDVASGLLPSSCNGADTARSEDTCNESSSD